MANAAEKEALGLSKDATDEQVQAAIAELKARAAGPTSALATPEPAQLGPLEAPVEVRIKHLRFEYHLDAPDPSKPGERTYLTREAKRGETVTLTVQEDVDKGVRHGAFFSAEDARLEATPAAEKSTHEKTDQELIDLILNEQPSVEATVALAGGDPLLAQRVLDAESAATGGEPREEVVRGLSAVLEGA